MKSHIKLSSTKEVHFSALDSQTIEMIDFSGGWIRSFFREYSRKLHINILIYPFPISAKKIYWGVMNLKLTEEQQLQNSDTEIQQKCGFLFPENSQK